MTSPMGITPHGGPCRLQPIVTYVMKGDEPRQAENPAAVALRCRASQSDGVLILDDGLYGRQLTAAQIKTRALVDFSGTVRNVLYGAEAMAILQLCPPSSINAQELKQEPDSCVQPRAVALSIHGKCDCSEEGVTFKKFDRGQIFKEGAIIRTSDEARADLFLRRTGTTIRLQAGTVIKLEKMTITLKDDLPMVHVLLALRAGRIFTVVRSTAAGSTLEIRNADGRAIIEGTGLGRYITTADGTHVSAEGSLLPLKVMDENGITIIAAGQQYARHEGKMPAVSPSSHVKNLIQLDELQAITEVMAPLSFSPKP